MMNRTIKLFLACSLFFLITLPLAAQQSADTLQTLEQRYTELLRRSENYQEYKVVRRSTLNMFWAALSDSMTSSNAALKQALISKMEMQRELRQTRDSLEVAQATIQANVRGESQVSFLGMRLNKSFYNALVWSLITALAGLMFFFLQRFRNGHAVVKETQQEHNQLQQQYDELRHKAKETQMKLKRELQTALNKLETVERH